MSDPTPTQLPQGWDTLTTGEIIQRCSPRLDSGQRKALKSWGHSIKPIVFVGNAGMHEGVFQSIEDAFKTHELIKIKLRGATRPDRLAAAWGVYFHTSGQVVQMIGNILLVYREHPDEPQIRLPRKKKVSE